MELADLYLHGIIEEVVASHHFLCWVVLFPQYGDKEDIADLFIHEDDLVTIPVMDARANERIKAQHEVSGNHSKLLTDKPDDLSGYLI